MATLIARPQSLGKPRTGGAQLSSAILQVTRGQTYRSRYLEKRKQQYEQILQFTMQEASWQMQSDEFKRKQMAAMADDLMKQANGLRKINADWAAGRQVNPFQVYNAAKAQEDQNKDFHAMHTRMPVEIDKLTQPTDQTLSQVLTVDNAADIIGRSAAVTNAASFLRELEDHLTMPGGSLNDIAEKMYMQEASRGKLVTRVAASDFADQVIKGAGTAGHTLSGPDREKVRELVGTMFGGLTETEISTAKNDQTTFRDERKAAMPVHDPAAFDKLMDAVGTGDVTDIEAALILERTQAAQALEAEAKKLREEAMKPADIPTYEEIIAKAAARQPTKKTLREQAATHFKKKKASEAQKYLTGGGTPEQQIMIAASADAIKTLRKNDGSIPSADSLASREAERLFSQWKSGNLNPDTLSNKAMELAVATSDDPEGQKEMQHQILTHFLMLKKTSQGGVGLSEKLKKEQEQAIADELLKRITPTKELDSSSALALQGSQHQELFESIIEANRKQVIDPNLTGADRAKAVEEAAAARAFLHDELPALVSIIPGASQADANLARALAANVLQDRAAHQAEKGDLSAANATRREANRFVYEIPEDYSWDSNIFSGYMESWHQQQYQWKPIDYESMVLEGAEKETTEFGARELDVDVEDLPEEGPE